MRTFRVFRGVRSWTAVSAASVLMIVAPLHAQQAGQTGPSTRPNAMPQSSTPAQPGNTLQLTMDQAVQMAVENNLNLKASRLNVDIAAEGVAGAQAAFKPTLNGSTSWRNAQSLSSSFTDLTSGTISTTSSSGTVGVNQSLPWYGGNYSAQWTNGRVTTTSLGSSFNPALTSGLTLTYTQPLWRGLAIDSARASLDNSRTQQTIANIDIQLQTITLQNEAEVAYIGLIAAKAQLDVAKQNYDLAVHQYTNSQKQAAVGVGAQADVVQAEVLVKSNEGSVIQAEASVDSAMDNLRTLIFDPNRPDYWTVRIEPTDVMGDAERQIDVEAAVKNALANRLDLLEARRNLDITGRNVKLDQDLTKISVNGQVQYAAQSSGGTQFTFDGTTPVVAGTKSFSSVLGQTFAGSYPTWAAGVSVGVPIGRSTAEANLAQAKLQQTQQEIGVHNLELQIAQQVRQAARDVQTNFRRVQAAKAAREASEKQLADEQRRQEVGLGDTFTLLQKQNILATALVSELQSKIDYNNALLTFDRVQKVR